MNPEHAFIFADGTQALTIKQLRDKLHSAPEEMVAYHVSPTNSDFASWVRHVHHNDQLADDLEQVSNVRETVEVLTAFLEPHLYDEPASHPAKPTLAKESKPVAHSPPPMPEHKVESADLDESQSEAEPKVDEKKDIPETEDFKPKPPAQPAHIQEEPRPFVPPAGPIPKAPAHEERPPRQPVPKGMELPKHTPKNSHHGMYEEFSFREFLIGFFLGALAGIALSLLLSGIF